MPAYVRTVSDSEVTEMALIENIQREDLNAIEVALAFRKLIDTYNLTQDRLSERLGKKRATIANHLRLLKLPAEIQNSVCATISWIWDTPGLYFPCRIPSVS